MTTFSMKVKNSSAATGPILNMTIADYGPVTVIEQLPKPPPGKVIDDVSFEMAVSTATAGLRQLLVPESPLIPGLTASVTITQGDAVGTFLFEGLVVRTIATHEVSSGETITVHCTFDQMLQLQPGEPDPA
jgi:hypothetical protein